MLLHLLVGFAALAGSTLSLGGTTSVETDPVAWITQFEHDAAAADLAGDVSFYEKNLADDWSDGMSNGQFQNKKELLSDLRDKAHNITFHETLADIKVRVYGDTAVATYTETYDALMNGRRVAKTIITTDTFAKIEGQWKLVAAHSSTVDQEAHAPIIGAWELVSTEERMVDGSKRPYQDVGPNGKGYLMYTADGHMCAALMNPDRPAWGDINKPTDQEKLRAMEGFSGYCGRYKIDTANHVIYHYPEVASDPNFVGTEQKRPYSIDGDLLTFSDKDTAPGVKSYSIGWKKTK
ncbi:MAG: lipocalin-like domain-containing protein [Acidobacteriaceae bacterium]